MQANVADRAEPAQFPQFVRGKHVAVVGQQLGRLHRADADQCHGDRAELRQGLAHERLAYQRPPRRRRPRHTLRRQQSRSGVGQARQSPGQRRRVRLHRRVAHAAQDLHDARRRASLQGMQVVDRPQQRLAPGRNPDHLTGLQRRLDVVRRSLADAGQDLLVPVLGSVGDDCLFLPADEAAIDDQVDAGDERRGAAAQKNRRPDHLVGGARRPIGVSRANTATASATSGRRFIGVSV